MVAVAMAVDGNIQGGGQETAQGPSHEGADSCTGFQSSMVEGAGVGRNPLKPWLEEVVWHSS